MPSHNAHRYYSTSFNINQGILTKKEKKRGEVFRMKKGALEKRSCFRFLMQKTNKKDKK